MRLPAALLLALVLAGCGPSRWELGPRLAAEAGWRWQSIPAGRFMLAAASAPRQAEVLALYLEGDGLAFARPGQAAMDPTPTDPLALRLALRHPEGTAVAWLGRPCQYAPPGALGRCAEADWTTARYSAEVVAALDHAVERLKAEAAARQLVLVGYSGGGALAALLAARRPDVAALVTVAANLDLGAWTRLGRLAPLTGSLDPAAVASRLGALPQLHLAGAADTAVPPAVAEAFRARLPAGAPARVQVIPGYDHLCCWARNWPQPVTIPLLQPTREQR